MVAFNGSGRAPAAATLEKLTQMGVTEIERTKPHSVIIPGAVDAWCQLNADHGRMPMAELLQPAIDLLEHAEDFPHDGPILMITDGYCDHLRIRRDHVMQRMLAQLGAEVLEVEAPFTPEGGAYGHGRTHAHDHGHSHP